MKVENFGTQHLNLTEKQENILKIAVKLFHKKGYTATSIRDITAKIGIKASSIYSHIQSKDEIFNWLAERILDRLRDNHSKVMSFEGTPKERFLFSTRLHIELIRNCPEMFDIFYTQIIILKNFEELPNGKRYRASYMKANDFATNMLTQYFDSCGIENASRFPDVANFAMMVINNITRWKDLENESTEEIARFLHDTLLFGIVGRDRS